MASSSHMSLETYLDWHLSLPIKQAFLKSRAEQCTDSKLCTQCSELSPWDGPTPCGFASSVMNMLSTHLNQSLLAWDFMMAPLSPHLGPSSILNMSIITSPFLRSLVQPELQLVKLSEVSMNEACPLMLLRKGLGVKLLVGSLAITAPK